MTIVACTAAAAAASAGQPPHSSRGSKLLHLPLAFFTNTTHYHTTTINNLIVDTAHPTDNPTQPNPINTRTRHTGVFCASHRNTTSARSGRREGQLHLHPATSWNALTAGASEQRCACPTQVQSGTPPCGSSRWLVGGFPSCCGGLSGEAHWVLRHFWMPF